MVDLTPAQLDIAHAPLNSKRCLTGSASCGKTTAGVERLRVLLQNGVSGDAILVLTPQRTLQEPYLNLIRSPQRGAGGEVTSATVGGLARRMVDLFWPLAAEPAGFARPEQPPVFLTMESAQYYMARIVRPLQEQGYFESLSIDRNRLYSQIIDNLNKAAFIGFDYRELGERLSAAWVGDPAQRRVYADAQDCATRFREYSLEHNLLDFSLQLEIFTKILWNDASVRDYLTRTYRHLIYDNVEEDIPVAHDLLLEWLPDFESALIIVDEAGGYRKFLGADPLSAQRFTGLVEELVTFTDGFVQSDGIRELEGSLVEAIAPNIGHQTIEGQPGERAYDFLICRFYPELLDSIVAPTRSLITESKIPPSEIVILAPYLSDALRFSLMDRLKNAGIPVRSHRPSRSLRDEPASHALLTLAALAHPAWNIHPTRFDLAYVIMLALDTDLVRAQLLAEIVYRQKDVRLSSFDGIRPEVQERITFVLGNRYTLLRDWLNGYQESEPLPLDHFLRKLFGEVLSQPGFGFHTNFDLARVAASLIESIKKFRIAMEPAGEDLADLGKEYISMLTDGVIAAQYLDPYRENEDAVLVAPATTFLMMNCPVTFQFWLDIGSSGWSERLAQPLTQPYVLARDWAQPGEPRVWTDADEVAANAEALARIVSGLLRRCKQGVTLGLSDLGETGFEQRGVLLRAFQKVLQQGNDAG